MPEKNRGGRPSKVSSIDPGVFERLLTRFNTLNTVAYYFGVSKSTLRRWVKSNYDGATFEEMELAGQARGRADLLDIAWDSARLNPAVLIFLLKNFCGLSDDPKPIDTGEERREFVSATKAAIKALDEADLSSIADIPEIETEGGADAE